MYGQGKNQKLGYYIGRLIRGENILSKEAHDAFSMILANEVTEMQQGAFLAALTAKGETAQEVAGGWKAIYEMDTEKVDFGDLVVDNCATGNFAITEAMSAEQAILAITNGAECFFEKQRQQPCRVVGMGEMGIGNTSSAAAIISVATGENIEKIVGRGTGLDDSSLMKPISCSVHVRSLRVLAGYARRRSCRRVRSSRLRLQSRFPEIASPKR